MIILSSLAFFFWLVTADDPIFMLSWLYPSEERNAILFAILGVGVVSFQWQYQFLSKICGMIAILVGVAINIKRFAVAYTSNDFFNNFPSIHSPIISASGCFILAGIVLLLINKVDFKQSTFRAISIICSVIMAFSVLAIFGHITGLSSTYGWIQSIKMSFFASSLFIPFCIAMLAISWNLLFNHHQILSPSGVSIPLGICFLSITLALWQAVRSQDKFYREQALEKESNYVVSNIHNYLDETAQELVRMTRRWEIRGGTPKNEWMSDAELSLTQQTGLLSIQVFDKNLKPLWEINQKNLGNNHKAVEVPQEILKLTQIATDLVLHPETISSGQTVIWILNPIRIDGQFEGAIGGVLDVSRMISDIYQDSNTVLEEVEIRDNRSTLIYERNPNINFSEIGIQNFSQLRFHGLDWSVNAVFEDSSLSRISYLPPLILFLGTVMSGLVLLAFHYGYQAQIKARELQDSLSKLLQAQDRLVTQEKLASIGGLSAGIAHEIKNPLNFIHNFSDLSLSLVNEVKEAITKNNSGIPKQEFIEIQETLNTLTLNLKSIFDQGKRAQNTIARILAQSRAKPGVRTPTDLHSLIEEYVTLSYHGMRSQDSAFNCRFDKRFDSKIDKVEIVAEDFSRVLLNLLSNSYYALLDKKKMGGETFNPEVIITTKHLGDRIEISIYDNGTGISESAQQKLFTPFYTTKPVGYGTGLGLSVSRDIIVEDHGGILRCNSREGEFTEFIIQIPIGVNKKLDSGSSKLCEGKELETSAK